MKNMLSRSVPLLDIEIDRSGDGRTVTAYAATFDRLYEVRDFDGHYDEKINRAAFNRTLSHGIGRVQVLYNHGRTIAGTPSDRFSVPLGVPVEVKAEGKGLLTVTRYNATPLADEILEAVRSGSIKAQSFRGPIIRSAPRTHGPNGRPVIERTELGLTEYGPAPFAINDEAEILAVRNQVLTERFGDITDLTDEERDELRRLLDGTPDLEPVAPADGTAPDGEVEVPPEDPDPPAPAPDPDIEALALAQEQRKRRLNLSSEEEPTS